MFCPIIKADCKRDCAMHAFAPYGTPYCRLSEAAESLTHADTASSWLKWISYSLEDMAGAIFTKCPDYQPVNADKIVEVNGEVC